MGGRHSSIPQIPGAVCRFRVTARNCFSRAGAGLTLSSYHARSPPPLRPERPFGNALCSLLSQEISSARSMIAYTIPDNSQKPQPLYFAK